MGVKIRRQKIKNIQEGNIIKIGDKFRRVEKIIKHWDTNQALVIHVSDSRKTIKGIQHQLKTATEFNLDDFVKRYRQI